MSSPLHGRRVVVTRAAEQGGPLAELLRARGAEVIEVPLIRIEPAADGGRALAEALAELDRYDWVLVTSPNGARAVRDALRARPPGRPLVGAVGWATAEALERPVDLVPPRQLAEGLLEAVPPPPDGGRILLAQADGARDVLAEGLREAGWQVDAVVAYRTVAHEPPEDLVRQAMEADALLLASGSAARSWVRAAGQVAPAVITIGPITSGVARDLGLKVAAEATDHSLAGLIEVLTTWCAGR